MNNRKYLNLCNSSTRVKYNSIKLKPWFTPWWNQKHIFFRIILYYKDHYIGQWLNLTVLCFLYVWFLQTVPNMWQFKPVLVLRWMKMCRWHWAVLLSPTHQWDLWPGGRWLIGERKSSNRLRLRPSRWIQPVPLTGDCTAVKPPMTLEV